MSALSDTVFSPLVIEDELLLAIYELELSTAPRQDQPPRSHQYTAIDGVPRPSQRCPEGMNEIRAGHCSVHQAKPTLVYARSPPTHRGPDR